MSEGLEVRELDPRAPPRRDLRAFLDLPLRTQADDPAFVPPLRREARARVDPDANPWFEHGEARLLLARRDGRAVARATVQIDHLHDELRDDGAGFFGLPEALDAAALGAVLERGEAWLRDRGRTVVRGPFALNINGDATGLLVEGFETPPYVLMGHNPPTYPRWVEELGYEKARDLLAWHYEVAELPSRTARLVERLRERSSFAVRTIETGNLDAEVRTILDVFNEAWADNWGFVPLTDAEAGAMAHDLRPVIDPRIALLAETPDGEVGGVCLAIPNLHEAVRGTSGGLLGLLKVGWRSWVTGFSTARLVILGVREAHQGSGLALLLVDELRRRSAEAGYEEGELGWTLEDNEDVNGAIRRMEAEPYKRYRIYEKALRTDGRPRRRGSGPNSNRSHPR